MAAIMTWNYRVMFFDGPEPYYAIHEVYYDDKGNPASYAEGAAVVSWEDGDIDGEIILAMMQAAFKKPVLCSEYFTGKKGI